MSEHTFEFVAVTKSYGRVIAVKDVTLSLPAGRHTAILGPSGCGKSTLLRLLTGLEPPSSGTILLNGRAVSQTANVVVPPHRRGATMVFQDLALWPNLTVRENIAIGLSGSRLSRQDSANRVNEALELCGIAQLANRLPGQLSGGQQQRAALARAIAVRPAFLLLDEPFSGIDLAIKAKLLDEIRGLTASLQVTVILVSHDPSDALAVCQHAVVMDNGTVAAHGSMLELLATSSLEPLCTYRSLQRNQEVIRRHDGLETDQGSGPT